MGGGKGGGSTNTVTNNAAPPPEVMAQYQNIIGQANNAAARPLQQYGGQTVAGFTPAQNSAFNTINAAQGANLPYFNQAQNLITQASQPITASPVNAAAISQYQNPYTQQVINSTLANINQQDAGQQQQLIGNAAASGAWGGDRSAVAQGLLANQQALAKNQTIAGLENQGYSQALGEANTQQQAQLGAQEASQYLGQQGAFGLTNLGNYAQSDAIQGANAQLQSGAMQQQLAQENLNVPYEQFLQQQAYPFQNIGWLSGVSTGLGSGMGGTSSTTSPGPSTASQLGGIGLTGLSLYGAAGGFGSSTGLARGGAANGEGLAKRIRNGELVMMPPYSDAPRGYDGGGMIIPGQMPDVPDLSTSYIPGSVPMTGGKGIGIPSGGAVSKTTGGDQNNSITSNPGMMNLAGKGLRNLLKPTPAGLGPDTSSAAMVDSMYPGFAAANDAGMYSIAGNMGAPSALESGMGFTPQLASTLPSAAADSMLPAAMGSDFGAGLTDAAAATATDATATMAADAAATDAVASIPEWATALLALFKRGGAVHGYDDGGAITPFETTANPLMNNQTSRYAQMQPEQLRELSARIPPTTPQGATIQKVLQQKQMMPNVGQPAPQPSARGGLIKGYADGSDVDDVSPGLAAAMTSADNQAQGSGIIPGDYAAELSGTPSAGLAAAPAPAAPAAAGAGFTPSDYSVTPPINKPNPWLALAAAGASMAAGQSPHALENIGAGALAGVKNYEGQQQEAAKESYEQGNLKKAAEQLAQEAEQHKETLALEKQKADQTGAYQQGELGLRGKQLAQENIALVPDGMGGFIQYDKRNPNNLKRIPAETGMGAPPVDPATGQPVSGEAYLATLPPERAAQIKALDEGRMNFPTGFALKSPYFQQMLNQLYQYNPEASAQTAAAVRAFNTGPQGNTVRSLNVATAHLDTLDKLTDALGNGDTKAINSLSNTFKSQFGSPAPTNFDTAKQIVADEVTKAVIGSGGTGADREKAADVINRANSPEQLKQAISTYKTLMSGQLHGLQQQYEISTGRKDFAKHLTPEAQAALVPAPAVPAILSAPPPAESRQVGQTYQTPKGPMTWTGGGWQPAGGQ